MFKPYRDRFEGILEDLRSVLEEAKVSEVPNENICSIADLIVSTVADGTKGHARPLPQQGVEYTINVIPSEVTDGCRDMLVAFCFDADSFNERLREVAYHAGIHCPHTKLVILVTSQWKPIDWNLY